MFNILNEKFEVHPTLNQKLFNGDKLRPEVRDKIFEIVNEFQNTFDTPISIVDIILCGSNASFNYTATSDLDVHIIASFDTIIDNIEIMSALYNMEKSSFNNSYNISIHGVEIELYVQDVNSSVTSNGIYSVTDDKWVKYPRPITNVPEYDLDDEIKMWTMKANEAINRGNRAEIEDLINQLYKIRQHSIASDGEYGRGNTLFKELRSNGVLERLKDAKRDSIEKQLTLESKNAVEEDYNLFNMNDVLFSD